MKVILFLARTDSKSEHLIYKKILLQIILFRNNLE
jgi:hypothetical protein